MDLALSVSAIVQKSHSESGTVFVVYVVSSIRGFSIIRKLYIPISCSVIMILSKLTKKDDNRSDIRPESYSRDKQQEDFVSGIFVLEKLAGWLLFLPEVVGGGDKIFLPG